MEKMRLWWKFEGRYILPGIKRGLINIWKWLPVIWKDRGYDHIFIFDILLKKLELQAECLTKYANHIQWEYDVSRINWCIRLIRLLKDDVYELEYMDYHEATHEFIPVDSTEEMYEMKSEYFNENFSEFFKKYKLQYKIAKGLSDEEWPYNDRSDKCIAMWISSNNHVRARRLLFKILDRYIEHWWD